MVIAGKTFVLKATISTADVEYDRLDAEFTDADGNTFDAINGHPDNELVFYSASEDTTVYENSTWADDGYRTITFSAGAPELTNPDWINFFTTWAVEDGATTYIVQSTSLTAVADAIRAKGGTAANLTFPGGFVNAIGSMAIAQKISISETVPVTSLYNLCSFSVEEVES